MPSTASKQSYYAKLPAVDLLLQESSLIQASERYGRQLTVTAIHLGSTTRPSACF